jgi:DNA-binding transcriptional MerR regulator
MTGDPRKPLRIGQLAARCGKTVRALHLYEQMGLLPPAQRSAGGYRLFDTDSRIRVEWIESIQALGLSLSEIRDFDREFERRTVGPQAAALARTQFRAKLAETRRVIERLSRLEAELVAALGYLEACRTCIPPRPSSDCPECDVPRTDPIKPLLLKGLYAKPAAARAPAVRPRAGRGRPGRAPRHSTKQEDS